MELFNINMSLRDSLKYSAGPRYWQETVGRQRYVLFLTMPQIKT